MYCRMFTHGMSLENPVVQEGNRSLLQLLCHHLSVSKGGVGGIMCVGIEFNDLLVRLLYITSRTLCVHSPVQLRAHTGALQSLHTPSYSSRVLSCIR